MRITSPKVLVLAAMPIIWAAFANAADGDLLRAADSLDIKALMLFAETAPKPSEREFARGVIAATMNDDASAEIDLKAAVDAAGLVWSLRCKASLELAGVFLRQAKFADAVRQYDITQKLGACGVLSAEEGRGLALAKVLQGESVMGAAVPETGETPLRIDWARLLRAGVFVNGAESEAVLDTGASYSTMSASTAAEFGVRILPGTAAIGTATGNAQARLGVVDRLDVAGAKFNGVPFIVLDDDALSFAWGFYRIPMIVGLPVLRKLGRVEVLLSDDEERLRYDRRPTHLAMQDSNLALDGLQLLAAVNLDEYQGRMLLDTGARSTFLNRGVIAKFPNLISDADRTSVLTLGAGGSSRDQAALSIDELRVVVAGRSIKLEDVKITGDAHDRRDGILGQDVLTAGRGYVLDFRAMRLELLEK